MPDRAPHPRAHTHGDEFEKDILDRMLTEMEGIHDVLARAFPAPVEPDPEPEPVEAPEPEPEGGPIDITEPATTPPRTRAAKSTKPPATKES